MKKTILLEDKFYPDSFYKHEDEYLIIYDSVADLSLQACKAADALLCRLTGNRFFVRKLRGSLVEAGLILNFEKMCYIFEAFRPWEVLGDPADIIKLRLKGFTFGHQKKNNSNN